VFYGRWLIDGHPRVLLFDIGSGYHKLNEWKADLWEKFHIPAPDSDKETNDAIIFGYLVAWFFGEVILSKSSPILPGFLNHFLYRLFSTCTKLQRAMLSLTFMSGRLGLV